LLFAFLAAANAVSLTDMMEAEYVGAGHPNEVNGHYPPFWYDCLMIKRAGSDSCLSTGDDGSVFETACPRKDDPVTTWRATDDTNLKTQHHLHKVFFISNRTPRAEAHQRDAEHTHELQVLTYDHQDGLLKLERKGDVHDIDEVTGILMRQTWHPANIQGTARGKTIGILDGRLMQAQLKGALKHHTFTDYSHNMRANTIGVTKPLYKKNHHISVSHQVIWNICMCPSRGGCANVDGSNE
jgi:hypothetical protein